MDLSRAHLNAYWWEKDRFLFEADKLIERGIGNPAYWHLRKADLLVGEATGERHNVEEWLPGDPIVDEAALRLAAAELTAALKAGVANNLELMKNWNERFASIISVHDYANLRT